MNNYFEWAANLASIFWANGRFTNLTDDYLEFLFQDDLTPEEAFDEIMTYESY